MVPSPTRRAAARTARTCALAFALALTLGGSRPALAIPVVKDRSDDNPNGFRDNRLQVEKGRRRPVLLRRAMQQSARTGQRGAFLRGPAIKAPGANEPLHLDWGYVEPVERRPGLSLGWSMGKHGRRHSDRQIVASRVGAGHSQKSNSRLSTAFARLLNGPQGDRRVQAGGFRQPLKPAVRNPLGRAQLAAGARRIMLTKRARSYLEQAAQGMNVRRRDLAPRGAVPKYDALLQDGHTRFAFAELCAGRCGDMKTAGEALRALPASRASIPAHRNHADRRSAAPAFSPSGHGAEMADASRVLFDGRLSGYWSYPSASGASRDGNAGHTLQ